MNTIAKELAEQAVRSAKTTDGSILVCLRKVQREDVAEDGVLDYTSRGFMEFLDAREANQNGALRFIVAVNDPVPVMEGLRELFEAVAEQAIARYQENRLADRREREVRKKLGRAICG